MLNNQGRPTQPPANNNEAISRRRETFTGNRGLQQEEGLIFEFGRPDVSGVDIDEPAAFQPRLGKFARKTEINLPGLSEPEAVRSVRLASVSAVTQPEIARPSCSVTVMAW